MTAHRDDIIKFTMEFHNNAAEGTRLLDPETQRLYVRKWSSWLRYEPGTRTPSQCFARNMVGHCFYLYGGVPPAA